MSVLILALLCGAVVGVALGALGGGGGVLAVPALVYLLGVSPSEAGTTSLVIVTATSVTALVRHTGTGNISWRTGALFAAAGVLPGIGASVLAHRVPQAVLTSAFAVLAALAAAAMLRGTRTAQRTPAEDAGAVGAARAAGAAGAAHAAGAVAGPSGELAGKGGPLGTVAAGAGLGAVTGLLGVGGGFLAVPALVSVLRLPMRKAVGTSLVVILINSVVSLATRLTVTGMSLDPAVFGPFVGAAVLGAWDGRRLAAKLSGAALQRTFAVLLLAVAAFMLIDLLV
ncbi:sulfite exporter TauE/SafE family protein [Streptomyces sp. FH025]|uniref:sulfite exporter TauE/SafE family protein n=1 Tax=Streptomyces sp. FH025 TaxID=2815937 RepID=UPI001A9EE364|nr:sulfite exporter TauE/SafE family protein [Streptomyces sp. FH025]MBO1418144.1 sulfite exporter TauE/SafE family protein [Streptomyces sp. FH025]